MFQNHRKTPNLTIQTSKEVPNMLSLTKDILPSEIYENTIRPEDENLVLSKSCEWVLIVGG